MKTCQCGAALTWWDRRFLFLLRGRWCKNCRFRMSLDMAPRMAPQPHACEPVWLGPLPPGARWTCPECGQRWSAVPYESGPKWTIEATPVLDSVLASQGATWDAKQRAAAPGFFYGDGGTIHGTTHLDVEVDVDGAVVAVWYRCRQLPFVQVLVNNQRAEEMRGVCEEGALPKLTGVHLLDP
jgi:hypothetical protein